MSWSAGGPFTRPTFHCQGCSTAPSLDPPTPMPSSKRIDTHMAEQMPGVHAILTGSSPEADLWWSYPNDVRSKLFESRCRFEGEAIAAVAAETSYQAWDAVQAIKVQFDVLPALSDELKSLQAGAPLVHDGGNRVRPPDRYHRGDVEKGFADADVVLEQSYRTECEIHTPLERHGCVAKWSRDRLTLWPSTQGVYRIQSQLSTLLGLPLSKVRVIGKYMGGGFGSKLAADKEHIIAALLAKKTGRPVKLFMTREETYRRRGEPPAGEHAPESRGEKGRNIDRARFYLRCHERGLPGRGTGRNRLADQRPVSLSQRPVGTLRCLYQCLPCPCLSCAGPSAGGVGFGTDDGCPGGGNPDGPGGASPQERPLVQPGKGGQSPLHLDGTPAVPGGGCQSVWMAGSQKQDRHIR